MSTHSSSTHSAPPSPSEQQRFHPVKPGDVSSAVRNLLTSTRQLQERLRQWSLEQASEVDVSDVYVQLGNELNDTISAFAYHRIDLNELHAIPSELREVLESCLSEDPSPAVFDTYVPQLRQIQFKLLKGLQSRQERWRLATQRTSPRPFRTSLDSR